ncbi:MAG: hypothetical protein ABW352_13420 [Polyangiales bacterium]
MKLLSLVMVLVCACGSEDTPGRRVEASLHIAGAATRSWTLASGWTVTLDEALVLVGPLYLRPPKRTTWSRLSLVPRAHAHGQTLVDGEVMGEYLSQIPFDVLGPELSAGVLASEAGPVDRLSIMLDVPRGAEARARGQGYHAYMRGHATRGADRVPFACGMRIDASSQETPTNLEARRRIDNVSVESSFPVEDGAQLRLWVHPERWFDFVSFDDHRGLDNPCARDGSAFAQQWYLGLRRPEAFSAELN